MNDRTATYVIVGVYAAILGYVFAAWLSGNERREETRSRELGDIRERLFRLERVPSNAAALSKQPAVFGGSGYLGGFTLQIPKRRKR